MTTRNEEKPNLLERLVDNPEGLLLFVVVLFAFLIMVVGIIAVGDSRKPSECAEACSKTHMISFDPKTGKCECSGD